ncbi:MAG: hypothetical protein GY811_09390 [Myxococcales bacterium]|nr:hypothetical protein [Myxococcales bacterium]
MSKRSTYCFQIPTDISSPSNTTFAQSTACSIACGQSRINYIEGADARGTAYGDVDGDGDLDIVQGVRGGGIQVLRNTSCISSEFLRLEVSQLAQAVGATVLVESGGRTQIRVISAGSSYMSSGPPSATFGLCGEKVAERVEIRFANGDIEVLQGVPVGVLHLRR